MATVYGTPTSRQKPNRKRHKSSECTREPWLWNWSFVKFTVHGVGRSHTNFITAFRVGVGVGETHVGWSESVLKCSDSYSNYRYYEIKPTILKCYQKVPLQLHIHWLLMFSRRRTFTNLFFLRLHFFMSPHHTCNGNDTNYKCFLSRFTGLLKSELNIRSRSRRRCVWISESESVYWSEPYSTVRLRTTSTAAVLTIF